MKEHCFIEADAGKIVGPNQIRISTQNLVNGIYEVELKSNNEQYIVRLIKE